MATTKVLDQAGYDRVMAQAAKQGISAATVNSKASSLGITTPTSVVNSNPTQIYGSVASSGTQGAKNTSTPANINTGGSVNGVTYGGASTSLGSSPVIQANTSKKWDSGSLDTNPFSTSQKPNQTTITPTQTQTQVVNNQSKITDATKTFGQEDTKNRTPQQFNDRNTQLAQTMASLNKTDEASVRSELEKTQSYLNASAQDKANTLANVMKLIPKATVQTQANSAGDEIAKQYGFKDMADFNAKSGGAVDSQVQSLLSDIAKFTQSGDQEALNSAKSALSQVMSQGAILGSADRTAQANTMSQLSQMSPQGKEVVDAYNLINNLISKGISYADLPSYMGKDKAYIDNVMTGQRDKLGVQVNPEVAKELTATLNENKNYQETQLANQQAQAKLKLQQNEEDYNTAYQRQVQENKIQGENMSKLARMMGIGLSSSGVEGMEYVFQQGQNALSDLHKNFDRNNQSIQNTITQISDAYTHNTNLYNLSYKDTMKNATQAFQTDIMNIQGKYGQTSDAAWTKIGDTTKTYMNDLTSLSKWRTEQQNLLNQQIYQRTKDMMDFSLQQAQFGLQQSQANKPMQIGVDEDGNPTYGTFNQYTNSFNPISTNPTQTILNETPVDTGIKNVYGSNVKLVPTVGGMVKNAQDILASQGIDLKIADSTRSFNTQKQAYESGKPGVAKSGQSFHEKGQAIDLSQRTGDKMNDPKVFEALKAAGMQQLPGERWHWSYGEMGTPTETKPTSEFTPSQLAWYQKGTAGIGKGKLTQAKFNEIDNAASNGLLPPTKEQKQTAKDIMEKLNELETAKGFEGAVGAGLQKYLPGWLKPGEGDFVPGTEAAGYASKFDTFKNTQVLPNLGQLKGPMSDKDVAFLKSTATSLNLDMDEESFKEKLTEMKKKVQEQIDKGTPGAAEAKQGQEQVGTSRR